MLFAERLSAVREYDSTGGYAGRAVRIALVGGTKGAGEAFEESDGSTGYENGRCGRISTAPEGYAARAVDCVSNGLENQKRVEKGFLSGGFNGWTLVLGFIIFRGPFEICYVFFCSIVGLAQPSRRSGTALRRVEIIRCRATAW